MSPQINSQLYISCSLNKAQKWPFRSISLTSKSFLKLIYMDVQNPSLTIVNDGSKYYNIFVDHYTKYI